MRGAGVLGLFAMSLSLASDASGAELVWKLNIGRTTCGGEPNFYVPRYIELSKNNSRVFIGYPFAALYSLPDGTELAPFVSVGDGPHHMSSDGRRVAAVRETYAPDNYMLFAGDLPLPAAQPTGITSRYGFWSLAANGNGAWVRKARDAFGTEYDLIFGDFTTGVTTVLYPLKGSGSGPVYSEQVLDVTPNGRFLFTTRDEGFRFPLCRIELQGLSEYCRNLATYPTIASSRSEDFAISPDGRAGYFHAYPIPSGAKATLPPPEPLYLLDFTRQVLTLVPLGAYPGEPFISSGGGFFGAPLCRGGTTRSSTVVDSTSGLRVEFEDVAARSYNPQFCRDQRHSSISANGEYIAVMTFTYGNVFTPDGACSGVAIPNLSLFRNPLYQPLPRNAAPYQGGLPASSSNVKSSADGKLVVFQSDLPVEQLLCYDADAQVYAPGCVPADTNGRSDVFRFDVDTNSVELVSSVDGVTAIGGAQPDIDQSGERIVFQTIDSGIVAKQQRDGEDYGRRSQKATLTSVFLTHLVRGASQRSVTRMSVGRNGAMPNGNSQNASISANGEHVSYSTDANNINPGSDANGVRDVVTVATGSGMVDCVSSCAGMNTTAASDWPSISNNGKVAIETDADNLGGASAFTQVVVFDPLSRLTKPLSVAPGGTPGAGHSRKPRIASSGAAVVYQSTAGDLTAGDANGRSDVFLTQVVGGASQRISRKPAVGAKANPHAPEAKAGVEDGDSVQPTISGDGRFVAFQTTATNLVDIDGNGVTDIVVADLRNGQLRRIYQGFGGVETDGASETPHLNRNGTHLGFHSFATNLAEIGDADTATSEPYLRENPQGIDIVFFDAFE